MKPIEKIAFKSKTDLYKYINIKLVGLLSSEENILSNISNTAALLGFLMEEINWVGFYVVRKGELKLAPFWGKPACTTLQFGKGVCGTAAETKKVQLVPDVEAFPDHVACDSASQSEIVLPIIVEGTVVGVLDVDSPIKNRFDQEDQIGLERIVESLKKYIDWNAI